MTPEKQLEVTHLVNDIEEDLARIDTVYGHIEKGAELLQKDDRAFGEVPRDYVVQATASHIHNFYTGVEKIYERIIIFTDGKKPAGEHFHKKLLETAHNTLKLTDEDENKLLDDLRGFRHVFRNAYGTEMKQEQVEGKAKEICLRWAGIKLKIDQFLKQFRQDPPGQI